MSKILYVLAGYPGSGKSHFLGQAYQQDFNPWPASSYSKHQYRSQFPSNIFQIFKATGMEGREYNEPWFNQNHLSRLANDPLFIDCNELIMEVDLSVLYEYDCVVLNSPLSKCPVSRGPMFSGSRSAVLSYFEWILSHPCWSNFSQIHLTTLATTFDVACSQYKRRWIEKGYAHSYADMAYSYYLQDSRACRLTHKAIMYGWIDSTLSSTLFNSNCLAQKSDTDNGYKLMPIEHGILPENLLPLEVPHL